MKKTYISPTYISPEIQTYMLNMRSTLLAGSTQDIPTSGDPTPVFNSRGYDDFDDEDEDW